jgi:hypothetical protein
MDGATLLSRSDIGLIRRYVETKYANMPAGRRAEIVADAIRRAVRQRLPALPEPWRRELEEELIRRCVIQQRRDIRPEDVLDICAERSWEDGRIREALETWLAERTAGRGAAALLNRRNPQAAVPLPGAEPAASPVRPTPSGRSLDTRGSELEVSRPEEDVPRMTSGENGWPQTESDGPGIGAGTRDGLASGGTDAEGGNMAASAEIAAAVAGMPAVPERRHPARQSLAWGTAAAVLAAGIWFGALQAELRKDAVSEAPAPSAESAEPSLLPEPAGGMPSELRYAAFDEEPVKAYLRSRDSLLADEPYFGAIVASARKHDVHPLLLLAIAGQEQGFVPKSHKQAKRIANNPFNVYHSWQEYNTDIYDSADIAARTIANLGRDRPAGYDPFRWFNTKYAEDPNWAEGVRRLFAKLVAVAEGRDGGQANEASS